MELIPIRISIRISDCPSLALTVRRI